MTAAIACGCSTFVTRHATRLVAKPAGAVYDGTYATSARTSALEALGIVCEALDTDEM